MLHIRFGWGKLNTVSSGQHIITTLLTSSFVFIHLIHAFDDFLCSECLGIWSSITMANWHFTTYSWIFVCFMNSSRISRKIRFRLGVCFLLWLLKCIYITHPMLLFLGLKWIYRRLRMCVWLKTINYETLAEHIFSVYRIKIDYLASAVDQCVVFDV